jgi:hypothetical protein
LSASIRTPPLATTTLEATVEQSSLLYPASLQHVQHDQEQYRFNHTNGRQRGTTTDMTTTDMTTTGITTTGITTTGITTTGITTTGITTTGITTDIATATASYGGSLQYRHTLLHVLATHVLQLRRCIKMMDIRQLGEAIYQAELWVSNVKVVPDAMKHTMRQGLQEMQRAKTR